VAASGEAEQGRRLCTNAKMDACNWLVDDGSGDAYCAVWIFSSTTAASLRPVVRSSEMTGWWIMT
jgi:hypothetical protein